MLFQINPGDTSPIYRQIVDQVARQIAGGRLRAGDELPSVRGVASDHAINPMTVSKAYQLMELQGLIERQRGQGYVVAPDQSTPSQRERLALLLPSLQAAAHHAQQLQIPAATALAAFEQQLMQQPKGAKHDKSAK